MYFAFREWQPSTFCIRIGFAAAFIQMSDKYSTNFVFYFHIYILLLLQTEGICHSPLGIYSNYFL